MLDKEPYEKGGELPLYKIDQTPEFLHEPYVYSHYRVDYTTQMCWRSMFAVHNQTLNIWTHMVPLGLLMWSFMRFLASLTMLPPAVSVPVWDVLAVSLFHISAMGCMICSVLYHTHRCKEAHVYQKWYNCDLLGILGVILGSFVPGIYYAFSGRPELQLLYCTVITTATGGMVVLFSAPKFSGDRWHKLKATLMTATILWATVPITHWLYITDELHRNLLLPRMSVMFGFYALGLVFYLFKIPEYWFPGKFDLVGNSHQLWHVCVAIASLIWQGNMIDAFHMNLLLRAATTTDAGPALS